MQIEPTGGAGLPVTAPRHSVDRLTDGSGFANAMAKAGKHTADAEAPEGSATSETTATQATSSASSTGTTAAAASGTGTTATSGTGATGAPSSGTTTPFTGILIGPNGYDVTGQSDPAFAQKVVDETNAAITGFLAAGNNAFGVGGYKFPDSAPFGPNNPLFTGQTYGPTWYPGSGKPEPPPSQWAIDPITGLPHDPATGGSVTPAEWARNSWNPESPNYDPNLYTAAGETPPK